MHGNVAILIIKFGFRNYCYNYVATIYDVTFPSDFFSVIDFFLCFYGGFGTEEDPRKKMHAMVQHTILCHRHRNLWTESA